MDHLDITIIGAGVIGLAVAAEVARPGRRVFIIEKNESFGRETSSRNSEVIHSGIYYPKDSLKARLCVEGRHLLYETCQKYRIPHRRVGKLVVAVSPDEIGQLEALQRKGRDNGVDDLEMLSRQQVKALEPNVEAQAALLCPSTGVLDSYGVMRLYLGLAREGGASIVYRTEVVGLEKEVAGWRVTVRDATGISTFTSSVVINCAGLNSDKVAALAGIDVEAAGYRLHPCKGDYFLLDGQKAQLVSRLIYPSPEVDAAGLGIHLTLDVNGRARLGPDTKYVDSLDYVVDETRASVFAAQVRRFLPFVEDGDLSPEMSGIRPKLQGPGKGFRDFVIADEAGRGLPGLVNLIGIESPGLTSSLAVGRHVNRMVANAIDSGLCRGELKTNVA